MKKFSVLQILIAKYDYMERIIAPKAHYFYDNLVFDVLHSCAFYCGIRDFNSF